MEDVIKSIGTCFSKFATFKGRASRKEFWWFFLFSTVFLMMLDMWAGVGGINNLEKKETNPDNENIITRTLNSGFGGKSKHNKIIAKKNKTMRKRINTRKKRLNSKNKINPLKI